MKSDKEVRTKKKAFQRSTDLNEGELFVEPIGGFLPSFGLVVFLFMSNFAQQNLLLGDILSQSLDNQTKIRN